MIALVPAVAPNASPAGILRLPNVSRYRPRVPSTALARWRAERAARLDELLAAHATVGGAGPGRRWWTEQLNRSLVLLLAAEFQGFARELHELGASTFASWAAAGNAALGRVIEARLTEGRQLDRGNAQPGSLGSDFGRLGMDLWPAMAVRNAATACRQVHLDTLNEARNAIAHADEARLTALRGEGSALTLRTFWRWRRSLNGLAGTLDVEVASHLSRLFGRRAPW